MVKMINIFILRYIIYFYNPWIEIILLMWFFGIFGIKNIKKIILIVIIKFLYLKIKKFNEKILFILNNNFLNL